MARKKNDDISNRAVAFMLVAFVLVSVVSLGVYMESLQNAKPTITSQAEGEVSLTIMEPASKEGQPSYQAEPAKVGLTIMDNEENN